MQTRSNISEAGVNGRGLESSAKNASSDVALSGAPREFHNFITDIEGLLKTMASLTGDELANAKLRLGARINAAKDSVEEMGGAIVNRARHGAKVTDNYVRERPWQAIGVGAALGLLAGFLVARRK